MLENFDEVECTQPPSPLRNHICKKKSTYKGLKVAMFGQSVSLSFKAIRFSQVYCDDCP